MSVVLDTSMAISWLFEEELTIAGLGVLQEVTASGAVVPSLWRLEIANALRTAVRRWREDEAFVDRSLRRLAAMPIEIDDQTNTHAWGATRLLSREHALTPYDAAYLELAVRLGLPLASGDRDLIAAASRLGVAVRAP